MWCCNGSLVARQGLWRSMCHPRPPRGACVLNLFLSFLPIAAESVVPTMATISVVVVGRGWQAGGVHRCCASGNSGATNVQEGDGGY